MRLSRPLLPALPLLPRPSRAARAARAALVLAALALATACAGSERRDAPSLVLLDSPAGPHSGEPFLAAGDNGRMHMTWLERQDDSVYALRYAHLEGDRWSEPSTIAARRDFFVNWADFPSVVATSSGRLVVHWLQRSGGGRYHYDVRFAQSTDDGLTWSAGEVLHRDGVHAEHGFVALWATPDDAVEAAWLDGRLTASPDSAKRAMAVATTRINADGSLGTETLLDQRSCDCCQVAAALTARGPVVAYRDRTEAEIRDIVVSRRVANDWTPPAPIFDDNWKIAACPVNGPALAARGDTLVAVWFTGAQDTARVRVAWSFDAGASFGAPIRIDGGRPAGRVDVELLDDGSSVVAWLERGDSTDAEIRLRRVRPNGAQGDVVLLARSSGARASGFPRLARRGDALLAAWTLPGDTARVHVGRYDLRALP